MIHRPLILLTNDDGIHAPGIKHLWQSIHPYADTFVVAPAHEQSAVSLSITIRQPLRIVKESWFGIEADKLWSVNGTPADCVKMALFDILPRKPDLIVSGINRGTNSGRNVIYSGTCAAVIEGVFHGINGLALSAWDYHAPAYKEAEPFIQPLVDFVCKNPHAEGMFLNVNFPSTVHGPIKGMKLAKQGRSYIAENPEKREQPGEKSAYYWLGGKHHLFQEDPDSDVALLGQGYATAVPIQMDDLTDCGYLREAKGRFDDFLNRPMAAV